MARLTKRKPSAPKPKSKLFEIDEGALTKGQAGKLSALRKSLGKKIADKAFAEWLESGAKSAPVDKNAELIAETLRPFVLSGKLRFPREGYHLTRGKGRVLVWRGSGDS